jgi:hypothetical protein
LLATSLEQILCSISWPPGGEEDERRRRRGEEEGRRRRGEEEERRRRRALVQQLLARSPGRILCSILWRAFLCSDRLAKFVGSIAR